MISIDNKQWTEGMSYLLHTEAIAAPWLAVVFPAPQDVQAADPVPVLYFPIGQGSQDGPVYPASQTKKEKLHCRNYYFVAPFW